MTTITRSNSRTGPPVYKDYVNFLAGYKNGKKEEDAPDSAIPAKNFAPVQNPHVGYTNGRKQEIIPSPMTNVPKNTIPVHNSCKSYDTFLENTKNKRFSSVKPTLEPKEEKEIVRSEIFIEIQPVKSVSEVSKIFQPHLAKTEPKPNTVNSKISIFEKQNADKKPKVSDKPVLNRFPQQKVEQKPKEKTPPPRAITPPPAPEALPPPPPPEDLIIPEIDVVDTTDLPPPPPPLPSVKSSMPPPPVTHTSPAKIQATLTNGPQTKFTVNNTNGVAPNEIDRNNPLVKKLVYGTLRGMYGAYHDKASDMLATLPKNMVVRSNGVQDRIDQIAANGDLDKLNGRINPKLEQD